MKKTLLVLAICLWALRDWIVRAAHSIFSFLHNLCDQISCVIAQGVDYFSQCNTDGFVLGELFQSAALPLWSIAFFTILLLALLLRSLLIAISKKCETKSNDTFSDEPISSARQDCLGRGAYVTSIRETLKAWNGEGSNIVGIYGEWGEGKTSVVNMFAERFCSGRKREFDIVYFSPWHLAQRNDLNDELFKTISYKVGIFRNPILSLMILSYAQKITRKFLLKPDALLQFIQLILADIITLISDKDSIKSAIKVELAKHKRRFVIVIDDLDRLNKNEIVELIRCIKTNGDLPKIAYLLLSDSQRLAKAMQVEVEAIESGELYLEKIIQCPAPLWPVPAEKFRQEANRILTYVLKSFNFDVPDSYLNAIDFCLEKFRNLRQVKRLAQSFSSNLSYYIAMADMVSGSIGGDAINVELADALILAAVKMIEPKATEALYHLYIRLMTDEIGCRYNGYIVMKDDYARLIDKVSPENVDWFERFLKETMLIKETNGAGLSGDIIAHGIAKDSEYWGFRIASPKSFRRYFNAFDVPRRLIPRRERISFLKAIGNVEDFESAVSDVNKQWRLYCMLEVVIANKEYATSNVDALSLVKFADYIVKNIKRFEQVSDGKQYRLVYDACQLAADNLERLRIAGVLTPADEEVVCDWLIGSKAYVLALFLLYYGAGQLEPTIACRLNKIDVNIGDRLWKWVKEELSCKIFEDKVASMEDGFLIQKFFMFICLDRLPIDMDTFKNNCEYFLVKVNAPNFREILSALVGYRWTGPDADEYPFRQTDFMAKGRFFNNVIQTVERYVLSRPSDISNDDLKFLKDITGNIQTSNTSEMSKLFKKRLDA